MGRFRGTPMVGTLELRLLIRGAYTLKDRRRVVRSLKDRIRNHFNVSVAELEPLDQPQRATIGVAVISNERRFNEAVLTQVVNLARSCPQAELVSHSIEH